MKTLELMVHVLRERESSLKAMWLFTKVSLCVDIVRDLAAVIILVVHSSMMETG